MNANPVSPAWQAFDEALVEAELGIRRGTVEQAARRSYGFTSGQLSLEESMTRIEAIRAADRQPQRKSA